MSERRKNLKITPVKGRPMLHWVGKKPLDVVQHFPAQLCESVGVEKPPAEPSHKEFIKAGYNLLFHGDNKEILSSLLVSGFRGKVDLIYIDPPFDSGADYVRKVKLRGVSNGNGNGDNGKLAGEGHTFIEQAQYEDIWANDNYLQFMYRCKNRTPNLNPCKNYSVMLRSRLTRFATDFMQYLKYRKLQ